jgi:hypothetical protein
VQCGVDDPAQSCSPMHWTHIAVVVSHRGALTPHCASLEQPAMHVHVPVLQTGIRLPQSAFEVHAWHV